MTWRGLIQRTLEDLGVVGQAQVPSPNDEQACLDRLNDWIDDLKTQALAVYQSARTTWPLTGAASYAIGAGQLINVARPPSAQFIDGVGYINQGVTPEYEVSSADMLISQSQYEAIAFKTLTATYPNGFYYDTTFPTGLLRPYPIANGPALLGVIYSGVPVDEVAAADIGDAISLPPGYRRFMRLGLQIECAPAFRVQVAPNVPTDYQDARGNIKRVNEQLEEMSFGVAGRLFGAGGRHSNIYSGDA